MTRRRRTGFPPDVVQLIEARSELCCEVMAHGCHTQAATIHHRRPRGAGGTRRADTNQASNGLAVCDMCHTMIERQRAWALDNGFLVAQHENPNDVPVNWRSRTDGRRKVLMFLDNLGGMVDESVTRF